MLDPQISIESDLEDPALVDVALITRAITATLAHAQVAGTVEVSVLVTNDDEIQRLNREFRQIDAPTDVLSFPAEAEGMRFVGPPDAARFLGDIAISYDRALAQASEYGHTPARELSFLAVHGMLHLLGYDHERGPADTAAMRAAEEAVLLGLGQPR